MLSRAIPAALVVLLSLGIPLESSAKSAKEARIEEIRALFAKLEAASQVPAPVEKQNKAEDATWSQLKAWDLTAGKSPKLRKIVVTQSGGSSTLERSFFFQGESLFFAFYVTTAQGSGTEPQKQEERLYFAKNGNLIRWQHNEERKPLDGNAYRWGAQAQSDAKVAKSLAYGKDSKKRFEPLTCIIADSHCQSMGGDCSMHYVITYGLFPPPGVPVQDRICSTYPWFAGASQDCSLEVKGRVLVVTESGEQECGDDPDCHGDYTQEKKLPLSPEMGRVVNCETPDEEEEEAR